MNAMGELEMSFLKKALEKHGDKKFDRKALDAIENLPLESAALSDVIRAEKYSIKKYVGSDYIYLWKESRMIAGGKVVVVIDEMGRLPKEEARAPSLEEMMEKAKEIIMNEKPGPRPIYEFISTTESDRRSKLVKAAIDAGKTESEIQLAAMGGDTGTGP